MFNWDANTIALITLLATVAGLAVALFTHWRSLERAELSKVRDSLVTRLEGLSDDKRLRNVNIAITERELIFQLNAKIIELDIKKYLAIARYVKKIDLNESLERLVVFDVDDVRSNPVQFRQCCYKLIKDIDRAYFKEIDSHSFIGLLRCYYYEFAGVFFATFSIYFLINILSFMYS